MIIQPFADFANAIIDLPMFFRLVSIERNTSNCLKIQVDSDENQVYQGRLCGRISMNPLVTLGILAMIICG